MIFWRLGLLLESEAALFPKRLFWNHWVPSKVGFFVWEAWWGSLDHVPAQELGLCLGAPFDCRDWIISWNNIPVRKGERKA